MSVKIGSAYGVKGGVLARVALACPEILKKKPELFDESGRCFHLTSLHFRSRGRMVLFFAGVETRTEAETLRGVSLFLPFEKLPPLEEADTFYVHSLVGCRAYTEDKREIGSVSNVANFGAGDLLEIESSRAPSFWVPFRREFVSSVDLQKREIRVANDVPFLFM